jgi:hypothetical protein
MSNHEMKKKVKKIDVNLCPGPFDQKNLIWKNYKDQFLTNQILKDN